jgi:hypothetical protein
LTTLRENAVNSLPKVVSNLILSIVFWFTQYIIQLLSSSINVEQVFILQTGLFIVSVIFLVRALFYGLTIADHLTKSFLKRLGIKEKWSRERILKDLIFIVVVLLVAAGLYPLINLSQNYWQTLQLITTYSTLGLILLFVFDIGRVFYRMTENKANSVVNRISSVFSKDEN